MNLFKAIGFKLISALLFAALSAFVRQLGDVVPVGQLVFFRSACAIPPVLLIYAYRGELTERPTGVNCARQLAAIGVNQQYRRDRTSTAEEHQLPDRNHVPQLAHECRQGGE